MNALTKLAAVNLLLQSIGEAPTNSLLTNSGSITAEVSQASTELDTAARSLQLSRNWPWNYDTKVTLNPDVDGVITIPANAAKIDGHEPCTDVVIRARPNGQMALWNRTDRSWTFTAPVVVDVTYTYDFDQLPEIAKEYVVRAASRRFQAKELGDQADDQFNDLEEKRAWFALLKDEAASSDANLFRNPYVSRMAWHRR